MAAPNPATARRQARLTQFTCIRSLSLHVAAVHRIFSVILGLLGALQAAELKVASLHPLLGDLARQVGGERVEVVDLIQRNTDPHHFEPQPEDLRAAGDARLFLASGMGLETYLGTLRTLIPGSARLVEVGATLPTLEGSCDHPGHHHEGTQDPHWWHSIDAFRRATTVTAEAFAEADPGGAPGYRARALAYRERLDQLERWARRQVARVPRERRVLATTHAAFGYFCHEYGFEALPVQGVNREQMPDAASLARLIRQLRESGVTVLFPEKGSNPKILAALTRDTGLRLAPALDADGSTSESYEAMVRHNVGTIVGALRGEPAPGRQP
jgi:zinc/manganese transport system substrate-binding protein